MNKVLPANILACMPKSERTKLGKSGLNADESNAICEDGCERKFQGLVSNWLRLHGFLFIQSRSDKKTTNGAGVPDFLVVIRGREILPIELKTPSGKLSDDQEEWHAVYWQQTKRSVPIVRSIPELRAALEAEGIVFT